MVRNKVQKLWEAARGAISIKNKGAAVVIFAAILMAGGVVLGPLIALQLILLEIGAALGGFVVWKGMKRVAAWQEARRLARLDASIRRILGTLGVETEEKKAIEIEKVA